MMDIQKPGDDQRRQVAFLPLDKLNGWLFGDEVSRASALRSNSMASCIAGQSPNSRSASAAALRSDCRRTAVALRHCAGDNDQVCE